MLLIDGTVVKAYFFLKEEKRKMTICEFGFDVSERMGFRVSREILEISTGPLVFVIILVGHSALANYVMV